jgi:hypothetical protein
MLLTLIIRVLVPGFRFRLPNVWRGEACATQTCAAGVEEIVERESASRPEEIAYCRMLIFS